MNPKKKIIFFDADGTLWYPKKTKNKENPVWIWEKYGNDLNRLRKQLILIPGVIETLAKLKKTGIKLIVLSASPHPPDKADARVYGNVKHFNLHKLFDEAHGTQDYSDSKGDYILKILKKYKLSKKYALMFGDSYLYDYIPARKRGIDAVLMEQDYGTHPNQRKVKRKVNRFKEILNYI